MNKFKKDDEVIIMVGKDKGKTGKVKSVSPGTQQVVIEGLNIVKKHMKRQQESQGGIEDIEAPLHWSNIMLIDPKSKKPTRVGFKVLEDGKKIRISKKSGEEIG